MVLLTFWAAMTSGGYAVAAGTGVVALNESYAIGSGTNVLLETAFNGDIQAYETTSMMIDLLGMGIVQCGIDNAALGQSNNKRNKKGVYVEKKSDSDSNPSNGGKYTGFKYKHNPSDSPKVLQDAIEDANSVYGYKPNDTGSLKKFVKYDWTDPEVVAKFRENRLQYHIENDAYGDLVKSMRVDGHTDVEIAKTLVEKRNINRLSSYIDENGRIIDIELYNQAKEHCVSYEQLRQGYNGKPGKTDLEIIESTMRGNEGMDACCGLYDDYYSTYK